MKSPQNQFKFEIENLNRILILFMSTGKYHTIDPLILETLNLNQKRMNYILSILHGRPPREYSPVPKKSISRSFAKQSSQVMSQEEESLPPILLNSKKKKKEPITARVEAHSFKKLQQDKSKQQLIGAQSRSLQKISLRDDSSPENKLAGSKRKAQRKDAQKRSSTIEAVNWEEEAVKLQEEKKKQLLNDYMAGKLKRSKSQEINPKDVYRMEIEEMVAQLTPIEELEQAEKKMQRLKKRTKHLQTFDKNYYQRLNQHDMVALS